MLPASRISLNPSKLITPHALARSQQNTAISVNKEPALTSRFAIYKKLPLPLVPNFFNVDIKFVLIMLASLVAATVADNCGDNFYFRAPLENGQNDLYAAKTFSGAEKERYCRPESDICSWVIDFLKSGKCNIISLSNVYHPVLEVTLAEYIYKAYFQPGALANDFNISKNIIALLLVNQTVSVVAKTLLCLIEEIEQCHRLPVAAEKIITYIMAVFIAAPIGARVLGAAYDALKKVFSGCVNLRHPGFCERIPYTAIWFLLIPVDILFTLFAISLAPILPLAAKSNGVLPNCLSWFQTPDNSLDGDKGWVHEHWQWRFYFPDKIATYIGRVGWLIRNPGYGFTWGVLAITPSGDASIRGNPKVSDNPYTPGYRYIGCGKHFEFYLVLPTFPGLCLRARLGWKLGWPIRRDKKAQYVFSVNPFMGRKGLIKMIQPTANAQR